jgi:hypothetical protein
MESVREFSRRVISYRLGARFSCHGRIHGQTSLDTAE